MRQGDAQHQRDASGQHDGDFKSGNTIGKGQRIVVLDKIIGRVVDTGSRHQRENARQQKDRYRGFEQDGQHPGEQRQGDDGQQGSGGAVGPQQDSSYTSQPTPPTSAQ